MPSKIQKMAFVVLIFSEGFAISILSYYGCCSNASLGVVHKLAFRGRRVKIKDVFFDAG